MTSKQRARSAAAKQRRREHILETALRLWERHTVASFTMGEVAHESGLAKGTLYLYFETKEELLLALLAEQLAGWFDQLDGGLADGGSWNVPRAAALVCAALEHRPALTRLLPIAASILEHNIPLGSARSYKAYLLERSTRSGALLEQRLGFLAPGDGLWLLLQIYALAVGLAQMADPAPVVQQILAEDEMAPLRVAFAPAFTRAITMLLHGLASSRHEARA
jgi:AcrR family transcriptional regulator